MYVLFHDPEGCLGMLGEVTSDNAGIPHRIKRNQLADPIRTILRKVQESCDTGDGSG